MQFRPAIPPAVLPILLLLSGPAHAASFEDAASGISIDVPDNYVFHSEPVTAGGPNLILVMTPDHTHPFVPGAKTPMCVITQWPEPDYAGLDQAQINAQASTWPDAAVAEFGGAVELESAEPFEHHGLTGMEAVARLLLSVTTESHLVFYLMGTPRGRFSMTCAATAQSLDAALATYRRLRDGVSILP